MDEPTAGVDAAHQASLTRTLGRLVDQGMTLLVVTHEIAPLLPILTRVVLVDGGRVAAELPPDAATAFVEFRPDATPASGDHRPVPAARPALAPHGTAELR